MSTLERRLERVAAALPEARAAVEDEGWSRLRSDFEALTRAAPPCQDRRRRWVARLAVAGVLAATGVIAPFVLTSGHGPPLVERAIAAINHPGDIEHVVIKEDGKVSSEIWWIETNTYRLVSDQPSEIASTSVGRQEYYVNPQGLGPDTVIPADSVVSSAGPMGICPTILVVEAPGGGCLGMAASLRASLSSGDAEVAGESQLNGEPVLRITFARGEYEVAKSDLTPRRLTFQSGNEKIVADISTFEFLEPTRENLDLLDLRVQHPMAAWYWMDPDGTLRLEKERGVPPAP